MKVNKVLACVSITACLMLGGCSTAVTLRSGDVEVVNEGVEGVYDMLLKSADYGQKSTTFTTFTLNEDVRYEIIVSLESYTEGTLVDHQEIMNYETNLVTSKSLFHLIMNAGTGAVPSIFSISELDYEKTEVDETPIYNITKSYLPALSYDEKFEVGEIVTTFDTDIILAGYVKYLETDSEKQPLNLETYMTEVANYETVYVLKANVIPIVGL